MTAPPLFFAISPAKRIHEIHDNRNRLRTTGIPAGNDAKLCLIVAICSRVMSAAC